LPPIYKIEVVKADFSNERPEDVAILKNFITQQAKKELKEEKEAAEKLWRE
jgi:hypothetical protein